MDVGEFFDSGGVVLEALYGHGVPSALTLATP
jgi:hypothetical protein